MTEQQTIKKKKGSLFLVWLIPMIAFVIAAWTVYQHFDSEGVDIVVTFDSADGLTVGKTKLKYKGIDAGTVTKITVDNKNIDNIIVTITLDDNTAKYLTREGTQYWLVQPSLGLSGVSGLGTIVSGNYIACMPAGENAEDILSKPLRYTFDAMKHEPPDLFKSGLVLKLNADQGDLAIGAPIFYKKFQIGKVVDYDLGKEGVVYTVTIDKKYTGLIKKDSKFYKLSALDIKATLAGVDVEMATLSSMITGGIVVEPSFSKEVAKDYDVFTLYEKKEDARLGNNSTVLMAKSGYNLLENVSGVYYKGVKAGIVKKVSYDIKNGNSIIEIKLYDEIEDVARDGVYYWIVEPELDLEGVKNIGSVLSGRYIAMSSYPDNKGSNALWLHNTPPPIKGRHLKLFTKDIGTLKEGSGVYYQDKQVGEINSIKFSVRGKESEIDLVVYDSYVSLLNNSSMFYLNSGVTFKASVDEIYFHSGSVVNILRGGISFVTPHGKGKLTKGEFTLYQNYEDFKKAIYLSGGGKSFTVEAKELHSVEIGSPILYRSMKAGEVVSYTYNPKKDCVDIQVYIEPKFKNVVKRDSVFKNVSGVNVQAGFNGVEVNTGSLATIVKGGLSLSNPKPSPVAAAGSRFVLQSADGEDFEKTVMATLELPTSEGLKVGSIVDYKGINIGTVKDISLNGRSVTATLGIKEQYKSFLKEDTLFWIETLDVGVGGLKNVATVVTGSNVGIMPGLMKKSRFDFKALSEPPPHKLYAQGLRVILKGSRRSSLKVGSPIYYRQIQIGEVLETRLSKDSSNVEFLTLIDPCYRYLVRNNSVFYNATALGFDVSLLGVKIETETLETLINGGISMVVPPNPAKESSEMNVFPLYDTPMDEWLTWKPALFNKNKTCTR